MTYKRHINERSVYSYYVQPGREAESKCALS